MAPRKDISSVILSVAVFILLEAAAVAILHSSSGMHATWLNKSSQNVSAWIGRGKVRAARRKALLAQNDSLREENLLLMEKLLKLESVCSPDSVSDRFVYVHANVVKAGTNQQRNYIVLDKGSLDGITAGCGIVTTRGVVGIVEAVSGHYSYGLSFMNPLVSVSARVGRNGPCAPLVWDGLSTGSATLQGVQLGVEIRDTVYTSGLSSIYPPGIPLGVPVRMKSTNGATADYEIRLLQDFSMLSRVSVVTIPSAGEMSILEEEESE